MISFADTGPVGVLNPCCTMDADPIRALTGRRRTRPTSTGCRKPSQPEPGRAPLILAQAAVQTNRATSVPECRGFLDQPPNLSHTRRLTARMSVRKLKGFTREILDDGRAALWLLAMQHEHPGLGGPTRSFREGRGR